MNYKSLSAANKQDFERPAWPGGECPVNRDSLCWTTSREV